MGSGPDRSGWIIFIVLAVAGAFGFLGLCFVVAPRSGAALFGIPAEGGPAEAYVRAIGFRDLTLGVYISALAWWSCRRALSIVLGATVIIPICDLVLLVSVVGLTWHLIVPRAPRASQRLPSSCALCTAPIRCALNERRTEALPED